MGNNLNRLSISCAAAVMAIGLLDVLTVGQRVPGSPPHRADSPAPDRRICAEVLTDRLADIQSDFRRIRAKLTALRQPDTRSREDRSPLCPPHPKRSLEVAPTSKTTGSGDADVEWRLRRLERACFSEESLTTEELEAVESSLRRGYIESWDRRLRTVLLDRDLPAGRRVAALALLRKLMPGEPSNDEELVTTTLDLLDTIDETTTLRQLIDLTQNVHDARIASALLRLTAISPIPGVRRTAVVSLSNHAGQDPEVRRELIRLASTDPSRAVRRACKCVLGHD